MHKQDKESNINNLTKNWYRKSFKELLTTTDLTVIFLSQIERYLGIKLKDISWELVNFRKKKICY